MNQRLYYLDNLKVCLTVLVIMHHAGQAYGDGGGWAYTPSNPDEYFFPFSAAFLHFSLEIEWNIENFV